MYKGTNVTGTIAAVTFALSFFDFLSFDLCLAFISKIDSCHLVKTQ